MPKLPFKKENVVWWELMPISFGDRVKVIKTGKEGWVVGMTVPMSHSGKMNITVEKYLRSTWEIAIGEIGRESEIVSCKRWEIEKLN